MSDAHSLSPGIEALEAILRLAKNCLAGVTHEDMLVSGECDALARIEALDLDIPS